MPRRKLQNKLELSKSLEKYNNTLNNKLNSINIKSNNLNNSDTNSNNINISQKNTIDNTIDNTINNILDNTIYENNNKKSLDTYFFNDKINNSNSSILPLYNSSLSTSPIINKISNHIISSSDSDEDDIELLNINTILSLTEIKNRIDNLYENEYVEIFKIIKSNNEKFTTNNNGIFINVSNLKPITINEITKFLIFSENNNKLIKKEEKERNIYRECVS